MVPAYINHSPLKQDRRIQEQAPKSTPYPLSVSGPADFPCIPQVPLDRYFPEYTGGSDVNKGAKYILWRFMQANHAQLNVYPQYVHLTWLTILTNLRITECS